MTHEVRILIHGAYPGLSRWVAVITRGLLRGREVGQSEERLCGNRMRETERE